MSLSDSSWECILIGGGNKLNVLGAWQPGDDTEETEGKRWTIQREASPVSLGCDALRATDWGQKEREESTEQVICGGCSPGQCWWTGQGWGEWAVSGAGCRCVYENHGRWIRLSGLLLWWTVFQQHLRTYCILEAKAAGIYQQWDCQGCLSS